MRRLFFAGVVLAVLLLAPALVRADGPVTMSDSGFDLTLSQWRVVARIYEYSDFYGLRDDDRDLLLRVAYRETGYGLQRQGDYDLDLNRYLSIGVFQWREGGVWLSTPCLREYGYAGRWNEEADVACAAWAFHHGLQSHWYPWLTVRWLPVVPPDPRDWLWGGEHPPRQGSQNDVPPLDVP